MIPELEQASRMASSAVQMDQQGSTEEAVALYRQAVTFLRSALRNPALPETHRAACERSISSYEARATQLDRIRSAGSEVSLPTPPSQPAFTTANPNPSVVEVSIEGLKVLNREGGRVIVKGVNKAAELNEKYDVTGRVYEAAAATATKAAEINQKYKVTETVSNGVSSAYTKAKQANQDHKILEKLGTIAQASVSKACEVNREYRITERVGAALLSGLNLAASTAHSYMNTASREGTQELEHGQPEGQTQVEHQNNALALREYRPLFGDLTRPKTSR